MEVIRENEVTIEKVKISDINEHPKVPNIRERITQINIKELAENIKEKGVKNPIVCFREEGKIYIVSGWRRLAACKELKAEYVPVIFRDYKDPIKEALVDNMIENLVREDVNGLELARRVQMFLDMGMKKDEISKHISKSTSWIDTTLKLLRADPKLQDMVADGGLSLDEAKKIARLPTEVQISAGEGLIKAKEMAEKGDKDAKKAKKDLKKAINEAGRERSNVGPGKIAIKAEFKKADHLKKVLEKSPRVKTEKNENPTDQEIYNNIKTAWMMFRYVLGDVKGTGLDDRGKKMGIAFDDHGDIIKPEEPKEEKKEPAKKSDPKKPAKPAAKADPKKPEPKKEAAAK